MHIKLFSDKRLSKLIKNMDMLVHFHSREYFQITFHVAKSTGSKKVDKQIAFRYMLHKLNLQSSL